MDNPLMYATGWKKEHVYVVATGLYEAVDVTERYETTTKVSANLRADITATNWK
jgi:hypothetical protein